jgi:hypothetical protein
MFVVLLIDESLFAVIIVTIIALISLALVQGIPAIATGIGYAELAGIYEPRQEVSIIAKIIRLATDGLDYLELIYSYLFDR